MKTNAIVRIVCYSLVALLLTGVLVIGIGAEDWGLVFHLGGSSGEPISSEITVEASKIRNIEIEWVAGDVSITVAADGGEEIRFHESGAKVDDDRAVWEIQGETLVIRFRNGNIRIGSSMPSKDLTITVPASWVCENLDVESVSGNVEVRCAVNNLDCESVSGNCTVYPLNVPKSLNLESVSGSLILGFPEDMGFTVDLDTVSGRIRSDFGTAMKQGDGSCQIDVETVSGDIEIRKVAPAEVICSHVWDGGQLLGYPEGDEEWFFSCTQCGEMKTEFRDHTHCWDEGTVLTVPGTEQQQRVYTCIFCEETKSVDIVPAYTVTCVNTFTEDMIQIPLSENYAAGTLVTVVTDVLMDVDLALYMDGEFVCYQTAVENGGQYHWEFYFSMPAANVTIQLKTRDGLSDSESYVQALALKDAGKIGEAAIAFAKLDGFMDARQQSFALWQELFQAETISAGSLCMAAVRSDGTVVTSGPMWQEDYPQRQAESWAGIISVSCGLKHILGIREDGTVVAAGENSQGQCNVSTWRDIVLVRAGDGFSMGLTADGTVVCAGAAPEGVAGWTGVVALECADNHVIGLRFDGTVLAAGGDEWGECAVTDMENVIDIYTDDVRTTLLCADGSIVNRGQDDYLDLECYPELVSYGVCAGCYYGTVTDGTVVCLSADEAVNVAAWQNAVAFVNYCGRLFGLQEEGSLLVLYAFSEAEGPVPDWAELMVP